MPMGSASFSRSKLAPKAAFRLLMIKSVYLNTHKRPTSITTDSTSMSFRRRLLRLNLSISRPKT